MLATDTIVTAKMNSFSDRVVIVTGGARSCLETTRAIARAFSRWRSLPSM
jgi:hypothetical protein